MPLPAPAASARANARIKPHQTGSEPDIIRLGCRDVLGSYERAARPPLLVSGKWQARSEPKQPKQSECLRGSLLRPGSGTVVVYSLLTYSCLRVLLRTRAPLCSLFAVSRSAVRVAVGPLALCFIYLCMLIHTP